MVITTTGLAGEKIIFDKLYVSETGTRIDLSLEVPTSQVAAGAVLSFRLMTAAIDSDLDYNAYKENQSLLKRDTFLKNIQANYIDIDFSFLNSTLIRVLPGPSGGTALYRLGTFNVQHSPEDLAKRNVFAFCTKLADLTLEELAGNESILSSAFFAVKEEGLVYTPENPEALVLQAVLSGPTSLLSKTQEVDNATTELKAAAFSQLFPSVKDDRFNFLYFLDLRKVLENNSNLFSLLSKKEQERALESTIIKEQLFKKESNIKTTAPEFLDNTLETSQVIDRTILNLPENVIAFTGGDEIKEYSKNLKYNYNTNIIFLNGIYPVVDQLINNITEIERFRSFMDDTFIKLAFYNRGAQTFYLNGLPTIQEDLQNEFNSSEAQDYPNRIDYFMKVIEEIIQATAKFDSVSLSATVDEVIIQLRKLISLDENANTNEYSFELFFRFFDSLVKELQQTFLGVGFQLSGAFSGKEKSGHSTNPEKVLIKIKHSFGYEFKPQGYSLRYSYLGDSTAATFPIITQEVYRGIKNENVLKYFTESTPTRSPGLESTESRLGIKITPTTSYLTIRSIKKRDEIVFNNTSPGLSSEASEIQGAKSSYLAALNIIKNKLLSINIERFEETSPESPALKSKLYNAINEIYNLISFIPFPFVVDKSDDFRRETTDSILESAVSNDVLRPSEGENNEIVEAIYNLDENFEDLNELNVTIENRLNILTLFLDYVENLIENPANYDSVLLNASLRNPVQFLESIRSIKGTPTIGPDDAPITEIQLPYPLYSLYETFQTTEADGRITFFWGGDHTILQNPLNSSLIRFNFANIKEIQVLTGFKSLENGQPDLRSPVFGIKTTDEDLESSGLLFCKMSNYNIGNKNTMWYLNNRNLLNLKSETEHFFIDNNEDPSSTMADETTAG